MCFLILQPPLSSSCYLNPLYWVTKSKNTEFNHIQKNPQPDIAEIFFMNWITGFGKLYTCGMIIEQTNTFLRYLEYMELLSIGWLIKAVDGMDGLEPQCGDIGRWDLYTITDVRLISPSISRMLICCRGKKRCLKLCICVPLTTILKDWFSQQMVSWKKSNKYFENTVFVQFTFLWIHTKIKYHLRVFDSQFWTKDLISKLASNILSTHNFTYIECLRLKLICLFRTVEGVRLLFFQIKCKHVSLTM